MYSGYILRDEDLDFLKLLIEKLNPTNILDPFMSEYTPLQKLKRENIYGCYTTMPHELIDELLKNQIHISSLDELENRNLKFDLIVTFPPLQNPRVIAKEVPIERYRDLLSDNGKLIVLYSARFYHNSYQSYLIKIGYYPEAIIELNKSNVTSVDLIFAIFGKESSNKVHLSKLGETSEYNDDILDNVLDRKVSKNIFKGNLVDTSNIKLLNNIVQENDIKKRFSRIKLNEGSLRDLSISISKLNPQENHHNLENVIFFPLIGTRDVERNVSDVNKVTSNIAIIELDESKILSSYAKDFLNSNLGVALRKSIQKGATIPFTTIKDVANLKIKVPSLNTQMEINRLQLNIQKVKVEMDNIQKELWSTLKSSNIEKYKRRVKYFDNEERTWIDGLPFPLSSILWNYYSSRENIKKVEHLYHFFEATSQFLTIFILSFYRSNKFFIKMYSSAWIDVDNTDKFWYKKSSFGKWNFFLSRLLKVARKLQSSENEEDKNLIIDVFKNPYEGFYSILDKKIIRVLEDACDLRNKHKGHGGISSDKQIRELRDKMELLLNTIKPILLDVFTNTLLVSAVNGKKTKGIYHNTVLELSGTRVPFSESVLELEDLLDTDEIYIVHFGKTSAIELLPLIKFNFDKNATYFYTSIETSSIRWVSYHYDKEPELYSDFDQSLFDVFAEN